MNLKIIAKGKSYVLPLSGLIISGIDMNHFLGLELTQEGSHSPRFVLDINLNFELTRYNQTWNLSPKVLETNKRMLDLVGLKIKKAECSKTGDLYVVLEDGSEISVPDAEYEGWHLNTIVKERIKDSWVMAVLE